MIGNTKKKIKITLLVSLIIFMSIFSIYIVLKDKNMQVVYDAITGNKNERQIVEAIYIDGIVSIYDFESDIYYCPINLEGNKKEITLEIKSSKLSVSKIKNKTTFMKKIKLDYKDINYNTVLEIETESFLYKNKLIKIKLTNIPIISMNFDESKVSREYINSDFLIVDPNYVKNKSNRQIYSKSQIRYRGLSSMSYEKKPYRIKLEKSESLLGMNKNKTWILDAIATEESRLRTKISSEIWNNINKDLSKEKYTNLNTKYVELYINGSYRGVFLLKEVIDENTLNLDENTGILVKGVNWEWINFNNYQEANSEEFSPFELKYPKEEQKYSISWRSFLDRIKDFYEGETNFDIIDKTFYFENFINQRIYLLILSANDNYEFKNGYYSLKNKNEKTRVLITPWDLDLTLGIRWDNDVGVKKHYEEVGIIKEPFGIKDDRLKQKLKERWDYLSKGILSKEKIYEIIDKNYEFLIKAEVLERENNKYYNADVLKEIEEIKNWYDERFEVINQYIKEL